MEKTKPEMITARRRIDRGKALIEFLEHEVILLDKAARLGEEEGIKKRLGELGDIAKEIDEYREILKLLAEDRAFQDFSISELKKQKQEEIGNHRILVQKYKIKLQTLGKMAG